MKAGRLIHCTGAILLVFHFGVQSQSIRQIEKRMQSGNWSGAKSLLQKAMLRDSSNVELNWLLTEWYYNKANPSHQIDSAYRYFGQSVRFYNVLNSKSKERLNRQGIDESVFQNVKTKIDSLAFDLAKQLNTINSYNHFITNYAKAPQQASAIELRDEVAFLDALKQNTYQSYFTYIQNYPNSHRLSDARARYEKLLYES
ncbi:MAG: hypothetical protein ACKOEV_04460, partial [Cytophagales bacterium]